MASFDETIIHRCAGGALLASERAIFFECTASGSSYEKDLGDMSEKERNGWMQTRQKE